MKKYLNILPNGKIVGVITTNDQSLKASPGYELVDITDYKNIDRIMSHPHHFHKKDGKIMEKSENEKKKADEDAKPKNITPKISLLAKISELESRLDKLERKT